MEFDFADLEWWHWAVAGGGLLLVLVPALRFLVRMTRFVVTGGEIETAEIAAEPTRPGIDRLFFADDR